MAEPRRVALLARPGEACERLRVALRDAGGEIVLEADPTATDPAALAAAGAEAVLVALDPAVEDALEAFDAVLADPALLVIFDEADLASRREGWDSARWVRHLAAKLHRSDDVLPPGREPDVQAGGAMSATADAAEHAHDLQQAAPQVPSETQSEADAQVPPFAGLVLTDDINEMSLSFDAEGLAPAVDDAPAPDAPAQDALPALDLPSFAFDADSGAVADDRPSNGVLDLADAGLDVPESPTTPEEPGGGRFQRDMADLERRIAAMTLVGDAEAAPAASDASQGTAAAPASASAVFVFAGIGGPDAVRQLLAALPAGFRPPVLVSQSLNGGKHDRLVQQMARAANLPVELAQEGAPAAAGHVYVVPPGLGLSVTEGATRFEAGAGLVGTVAPADSAVLLLSGSDPALVEPAMAQAFEGALVAAQSPDGCYDADAPNALAGRGATAASPAALVALLLQRWPA